MTTPTIRYVAEIDTPTQPYTGPAMLGTMRLTVGPERAHHLGRVALTSDGWHSTALMRAVEVKP